MKYQDFYDRNKAFSEFKDMRNKLNDALSNPRGADFKVLFNKYKHQAAQGEVVAQDVIAYFYRDGASRFVYEDYLKYMKWEILSASNGNKFAIDKLQFFLGYAYDLIVENKDFGKIKYKNDIDEYNYIFIIGQKICQQLVADLKIDAFELAESKDIYNPYKPEDFRDLRKAVDDALPKVIENMLK